MDTRSLTESARGERERARAFALFADKAEQFAYVGGGVVIVPSQSQDGKHYLVDARGGECGSGDTSPCKGFEHRGRCSHVRSGKLFMVRSDHCQVCGERQLYRNLEEAPVGSLSFVAGDLVCRWCVRARGGL